MSDKLKKAGPPPLPKDAFKQPSQEMESPWDVQSSAPAPKPVAKPKLALPMWAGRPIAAHDHSQQLDIDAAMNEFGLRMPREQAEDEAYKQYLYHPTTGQHAQAAFHHLAGMKAAHAAGNMEAARNHSLMYDFHAKALGKTPVDAARELSANIKQPAKVYKFKSHRGDAFAVSPPPTQTPSMLSTENGVISSAPPPRLNKREEEVLHLLYVMGKAALRKGEVVGHIPGATPPKQPRARGKGLTTGNNDLDNARAKRWARAQGIEPHELEGDKGPHTPTKKGEMSPTQKKHCKCNAYHFPHRHGGGKCIVVDPQ